MYFPFTIGLEQTYDKARNAVALALSPVVRALVDPDGAMRQIRDLDSVRMISIYFICFYPFFIMILCKLSVPFTKISNFLILSSVHINIYRYMWVLMWMFSVDVLLF